MLKNKQHHTKALIKNCFSMVTNTSQSEVHIILDFGLTLENQSNEVSPGTLNTLIMPCTTEQ